MASFEDILNTPVNEHKPPKPLPPGEYLGLIDGQPELTQRGKNQTHCVVFPIKLMQALNQSPTFQQELTEALEGKSLSDVRLSNTMWMTPDSAYRLGQFLNDHLGIEGVSTREAISMSQGKQLIVTVGHYVVTREGEAPRIGMEIKSTARA